MRHSSLACVLYVTALANQREAALRILRKYTETTVASGTATYEWEALKHRNTEIWWASVRNG